MHAMTIHSKKYILWKEEQKENEFWARKPTKEQDSLLDSSEFATQHYPLTYHLTESVTFIEASHNSSATYPVKDSLVTSWHAQPK